MKVKIIVVEPQYDGNLGFIARSMKNFGLSELILVNPIADKTSVEARSRAMHAQDVLKKSKIVKSLKAALRGVDVAVATTARTFGQKIIPRSPLNPKEFTEQYKNFDGKIAIVFGREDNGLINEEIQQCDFAVFIPSDSKYRTLNLSHAATILFYELFQKRFVKPKKESFMKKIAKEKILFYYEKMLNNIPELRKKEIALSSLKHVVTKSPITEKEAHSVLNVFKRTNYWFDRLKRKK